MHFLDVCDLLLLLITVRFGLGVPHNAFIFTCHMYMHPSCIRSFLYTERAFTFCSFSLSLLDRLCHGIQTAQIYSSSESSWFRVIFFFYSSRTLLYLVPWWEGLEGLLWELPGSWHSSGTPGHSVGFLRHNATWSHSNSGMGISLWETRVLSRRVYTGVLL